MKKTIKAEARKCVVCGKKFTPKVANQLTCCDKCRKANKALRDKARKVKAAPAEKKEAKAVKGKGVEKIALPKKAPVNKPNIDTIVTVKGGDPFKVFFLAQLIMCKAIDDIRKKGLAYKS